MKAIIYTRVSSDEQVKGTSLDFQEKICRKYCEDKGMDVLAVFREEGVSAKSADRKEFLRAVEFCRKNKANAFIVAKVDRFARNTEDHFAVRKILLSFGTVLHSVTETIGVGPTEKLLETLLAGFSDFDNAIRKGRCSDGMSSRINMGIYPWKAPIGYKCQNFKKKGEKKTEADPPDKETFPIIQRALKEFKTGTISKAELARQMDQWGLEKIRGKKTTPQFIDLIFAEKRLKFYTGIIVNPFEENKEVKGLHKPMITEDELTEILFVLSGKSRKIAKYEKQNPDFPLRRTVTCSPCNRMLTGSAPKGNGGRYLYYHCQNKQCSEYGKSIRKADLEKDFLVYLSKITPKQEFLNYFKETVLDLWQEKGKSFEIDAHKYENHLVELTEKRKRIFDMREDGSYTQEQFKERLQEIDTEMVSTKISISENKIEQFDIEGALEYATSFIKQLGQQWFDLPHELKPRFQKLVFPVGCPYSRQTGFGTMKLGYIYELNEINRQTGGDLSTLVDPTGLEPATSSVQVRRSTR
jgi:site-specific DNA recombinase